jgi:hypothetical protein
LAFALNLVRSERARLPQHRIDESGLAMVNVSDDRYVTQIFALLNRQIF